MVQLLGFRQGRSQIGCSNHHHRGRAYIANQRDGRVFHVGLGVFPGLAGIAIIVVGVVVVGHQYLAVPVHDGLSDNRCPESLRLANNPGSHDAARAATSYEEIFLVNVSSRDHCVNPRDEVIVILPRVVVVKQIAKLFAITRAATRIRVEDHISGRGVQLHLGREPVAIIGNRTP